MTLSDTVLSHWYMDFCLSEADYLGNTNLTLDYWGICIGASNIVSQPFMQAAVSMPEKSQSWDLTNFIL